VARPLVIPVITGSALAATAVFTAARAVRADRRARAAKQVAETQRQESNASQTSSVSSLDVTGRRDSENFFGDLDYCGGAIESGSKRSFFGRLNAAIVVRDATGKFLWFDACAEASCGFESLDGRTVSIATRDFKMAWGRCRHVWL
jgi:hypothetical protein